MAKPKIGFIGLGIMGKPMSRHLLSAGYELVVHNRSREAVAELVDAGAQEAHSPGEVARNSSVIITMLPDSPDVESVALGPDGIIEGVSDGDIFVDMSTIAPSVAVGIGEAMAEKSVVCLDAPVSGGDVGAQNATLSIMVGGDEETFETVRPIFEVMGKNIVLCGPLGAGQTVKACNQVLVAVTIAGVSEALVLGAKAGVDPIKIVQVLSGGLARCGVLENRGERMVNGDFDPRLPYPAALQRPQHHHENRKRLPGPHPRHRRGARTLQHRPGQRPGRVGPLGPAHRPGRPGRH